MMFQQTLKKNYVFEGKGLHTGRYSHLVLRPAPADTGIRFLRTDLGPSARIDASASRVSGTARSTTLSDGEVSVATVEHLLSAFTGLGVDNAIVELDNVEVPILDGSAAPYVRAIAQDGLQGQAAERVCVELPEPVEIRDGKTGSWVRIEPADAPSYAITVDFGSRVLGVQEAAWDPAADYAAEIAPCRTFVFFHELEYLLANNLIKGGDVDNAIVIVEHPVSPEAICRMAELFRRPALAVEGNGYLNNLQLHFPNECGRHKLLDLIGDLRLCGGFLKARVTAYKPGHGINTRAAAAVQALVGEAVVNY